MPDAINTLEVDGVEPSILVSLTDAKDNPERVKLFTADDGTERFLVKGADKPTLVTNKDLGILGGFEIKNGPLDHEVPVVSTSTPPETPEPPTAPTRPESTIVIPSPLNTPTPGQSGQ